MKHEELIERLQGLEHSDCHVDWDVAVAAGVKSESDRPGMWAGVDQMAFVEGLPCYTSSIDAALTLVPAEIDGRNVFPQISKVTVTRWDCHLGAPGPKARGVIASATTPAIAIVIAALRAQIAT